MTLVIAVDVSGSAMPDLPSKNMHRLLAVLPPSYQGEVIVLTFDLEIFVVERFQYGSALTRLNQPFQGRHSGTDFRCIWSYLRTNKIIPKMLYVLTDGWAEFDSKDYKYCPTTFVNFGNYEFIAPFGVTV